MTIEKKIIRKDGVICQFLTKLQRR